MFYFLQVVEMTRIYVFEVTIQENPFKKKLFNFLLMICKYKL